MNRRFDPEYVKRLRFDPPVIEPVDTVDLTMFVPSPPPSQSLGSLRAKVAEQGGLADPARNVHSVDLTAWADLPAETQMYVGFSSRTDD